MISIVTTKDKEVLYSELLSLTPTDFQPCLLSLVIFTFKTLCIEQIINLLVVDLKERDIDIDSSCASSRLSLFKDFIYRSNSKTYFSNIAHLNLASSFFSLALLILVTLHRVSLARSCLSVCEYSRMKALNNLGDQAFYLQLIEDVLLTVL